MEGNECPLKRYYNERNTIPNHHDIYKDKKRTKKERKRTKKRKRRSNEEG